MAANVSSVLLSTAGAPSDSAPASASAAMELSAFSSAAVMTPDLETAPGNQISPPFMLGGGGDYLGGVYGRGPASGHPPFPLFRNGVYRQGLPHPGPKKGPGAPAPP
ncbi:MAG: hypothetical protein CM15mP6_2280 [Methanobacteriota archaeon]|nr:MAG: hypothetical protein CM15mP6_2280 [Euryarchaeota archaeon]